MQSVGRFCAGPEGVGGAVLNTEVSSFFNGGKAPSQENATVLQSLLISSY